MELELLFSENCWRPALRLLEAWRALELIQRGWEALPRRSEMWLQRLGPWGHAIIPIGALKSYGWWGCFGSSPPKQFAGHR